MKPLAITGVGSISPLAADPAGLLAGLDDGRHGFSRADVEGIPGQPIPWAGRVLDFNYKLYIAPMKARRLDAASRMAVAAARQALAHAGLDEGEGPTPQLREGLADDLGVMVGTSSAGSGPLTVFLDALFRQSPDAAPPFEFPNTVANAPGGHISLQLGLRGPNSTLSHSETVIAQALLFGSMMIEEGRCSSLLAGAVDEWNGYYQAGYTQIAALRPEPTGGGGMLLAEGATFLTLETPRAARARGAEALASLRGAALGSCPGEPFRWAADADRLEAVLRQALADAGATPEAVGSVVLAANGVQAMEESEARALARLFGGRKVPATGVKGALGERAVSGANSVAVAALARQRGQLPPYAGGALRDWPEAVELLSGTAPMPAGPTLVVLYGSGGNFGAVILDD